MNLDEQYTDWARGNTLAARAGKQEMPSAKHLETFHKVWMILGKFPSIMLTVTYGNVQDYIQIVSEGFTLAREVQKLLKIEKFENVRDQFGSLSWRHENIIIRFSENRVRRRGSITIHDEVVADVPEDFDIDEAQLQVEGPVYNIPIHNPDEAVHFETTISGDPNDGPLTEQQVNRIASEERMDRDLVQDYDRTRNMEFDALIEDTRLQMRVRTIYNSPRLSRGQRTRIESMMRAGTSAQTIIDEYQNSAESHLDLDDYKRLFQGILDEIDNGHIEVTEQQRERLSGIEDMLDNDVLPSTPVSELLT